MARLPSVSVRALAMASKAFCRFAPRSFTRTLLWYCAFSSRASAHTALRSTAAFPFALSRMARSCAFNDPAGFSSRSFSSTTRCISVMSASTSRREYRSRCVSSLSLRFFTPKALSTSFDKTSEPMSLTFSKISATVMVRPSEKT